MALTFIEWLKKNNLLDETGTSTNCVANYAQPIGGYVELPKRKKRHMRHEGKEGMGVDDGYKDSPALKDTDEFWGPAKPGKAGQDQQAHDYGLGGKLHQLGVGPMMTEKPTGTNRLKNRADDLPFNNAQKTKNKK